MLCVVIVVMGILMMIRTYSELCNLRTFEERFKYLSLNGVVGSETFGFDRYLNQKFYRSREWQHIRDLVIIRDAGCDLGIAGHEIGERIVIHHMNPILSNDIIDQTDYLLNPEFLICTAFETHNAIHYGDEDLLIHPIIERVKNDTSPWKK